MKAGIITLYGNYNYGNRLQNQAVSTLLADRGISSTTLIVRYGNSVVNKVWKCRNELKETVCFSHAGRTRRNAFRLYSRTLPHEYILSETDRKNAVEKYDFFVIGSDQIWHPDVYRHFGEQFGEFCPADRIMCLSPSFGVAEIPDDVESAYQEGLCRIQRLSVREEAGAQIIKRLTGKSATVLCDPTMGIEPKRWLKMSSLSACPDQKYALAYFLGGLDENDEKRLVEKVEAVGLKYVDVLDVKNVEQYSASPNSFLGLISQADIVLTDSFHASVFSLLFTKPLAIIARREKGMGTFSRLETLADSFFVTDRLFTSTEALSEESLRQLMEERLPYSGERSQKALCELNNYIDSELIRMFG